MRSWRPGGRSGGFFRDADGAAEEFGGEVDETDVAVSAGFDEVGWGRWCGQRILVARG